MHSTRGSAGASGANKCCKKVVGQKRDPLIFTKTVATMAIFSLVRALCFTRDLKTTRL